MSATATFPLYALGAAELLLAALLVMPLTSLNRVGLSLLSICKSHAGGVVSMTTAAFLVSTGPIPTWFGEEATCESHMRSVRDFGHAEHTDWRAGGAAGIHCWGHHHVE